jgi:hypothetical protein
MPRRLGIKIFGGLVAILLFGWFVYASINILNPPQDISQSRADAVVSLAPQSQRLPVAQQLIADGVADTLVISYFDHDSMNYEPETSNATMWLQSYCESEAEYEIVCFTPEEDATIGEAYGIAAMAHERTWESLTVVTDTTHVFRTRFLMDECLGEQFDVNVVVAERELDASAKAWYVIYENAAFVKAFWQAALRC